MNVMTAITNTGRSSAAHGGVNFGRIARAEWVKLRSLRSTAVLLTCTVAVMIALGMLGAWGNVLAADDGNPVTDQAIQATTTAGLTFSQLIVGAMAVLLIASEYGTGMIRTTMLAVPRRVPAVLAKSLVIALAAFVVGTGSAFLTYFAVQPVLAPDDMGFELDAAVAGSLLSTGLYLALVALMGIALGALLRNSAGSIVTLSALLLVIPMALSMIPGKFATEVSRYLPSNAGNQLTSTSIAEGALTQLEGGLVMAAWATIPLIAALVAVRQRDV